MGLLDITDDPQQAGLLSLGLRLMSTPGRFGSALGQAGLGAMGDMRQAQQAAQARKQDALRQQMLQMQMQQMQQAQAEAQAQAQREEDFRRRIPSPQGQALQALGADASPTLANAARMPQVDPRSQLLFEALQTRQIKPMDYVTATAPKAPEFKVVGDSLVQIGGGRVSEAYRAPPKPEAAPSAVREYQVAKEQGYPGTFQQYQLELKRAGASNVTVPVNTDSLGLKPKDRFEMEQKLAADYTTATKTDRGIVSVSSDLTNILQQPGAIKDQAAIYKFAKFLDPEGAVREADYAAIVKTAGGLDYVKNLVNRAMTGEQLGTKQRAEMDSLVRSMAAVAQRRIDGAKKRFTGNAKMYNLDPDNIFQMGDDQVPSLQDAAQAELARRQGGR